jgi:hypothetical protein
MLRYRVAIAVASPQFQSMDHFVDAVKRLTIFPSRRVSSSRVVKSSVVGTLYHLLHYVSQNLKADPIPIHLFQVGS